MDRWFLQVVNQAFIDPSLDWLMVAVTVGAVPGLPLIGWLLMRRRHAVGLDAAPRWV